jgi:hypothetical protein
MSSGHSQRDERPAGRRAGIRLIETRTGVRVPVHRMVTLIPTQLNCLSIGLRSLGVSGGPGAANATKFAWSKFERTECGPKGFIL